jgi:hypothetical protein
LLKFLSLYGFGSIDKINILRIPGELLPR